MKRYISLFGLWTRQCVYKFMLLLVVMVAAETGAFAFRLRSGPTLEHALTDMAGWCPGFFLLLCALMCWVGTQGSGKLGYTLSRLRVRKWGAFLCHWLHNSVYFFLFWFAQTGIMLGLCRLHKYVLGVDYGPQAVLLASYRVNFFHSLLPLADWGVYVCNCLMALALGAATAQFSAQERKGKRGKAIIIMAALTVFSFTRSMGSSGSAIMGIVSVIVTAWCAVSGMELLEEENNETTA